MKFSLRLFSYIILGILLIPIFYLILYAISIEWTSGLIPQKFAFNYFGVIFKDPRFYAALGRSILLAGSSTFFLLTIVTIALYGAVRYESVSISLLEKTSFTISLFPPIVMSVGVLTAFARPPFSMTSSPAKVGILLIGLYTLMPISFVMRLLINGMEVKKMKETIYVSEVLGASLSQSFFKVFLPALNIPLLVAAPLSFNSIFGEIIYLNMLAGSRMETIMVYIDKMRKNNPGNASAMTVVFYLIVFIITYFYLGIMSQKKGERHEKCV